MILKETFMLDVRREPLKSFMRVLYFADLIE